MLTSYMVSCPHLGCQWFGSLLPSGDTWVGRSAAYGRSVVRFQCPRCRGSWDARVVGDDVEPLPVEEDAALPVA